MADIVLETVRAVILFGIVLFLLKMGRSKTGVSGNGWKLIVGGFGLLLFASLLDITDNFESLNRYVVIGDTEVEAFLEKLVGFLGGFILLALGLLRWIPGVQRLSEEVAQRERAEEAQRRLIQQGVALLRLADDLRLARDEARAADRAKSEFLAALSHELRTPLNAIIGFSEIIKDETYGHIGSAQFRDYANDINSSGQHLLALINDILDLSKIESGTDELHEDNIDIPAIIRSALNLVGQRAEQAGIKLELEPPDQLPALRADERKLKQILVNLLSNAVKFTTAGGEVTLRAWCRMDSGHVFQIVDTGIGIAPDDIPKALSRFGQVNADMNRQYEGTGLGLPLTKALVEQHGGVLDLQSEVGVGTTVTVSFPAERIVASLDNSDSLDVEARAAS